MTTATQIESLELAIKSQEAIVVLRSLEVTQALNAKRYANKYNGKLMAQLKQDIEDAQVRHALATQDLMAMYSYKQEVLAAEESN
mgnify:CR=1 FL=1